jgi:2-polyprenyl-3-methyl-5-hydroxy-6-metoxy-1,4-benzoquinol methylase
MASTLGPLTLPCPSGRSGHEGIFVFRKEKWSFFRCRTCQHLWTDPLPTPEELRAYYDQGYFQGDTSRRGYADYDKDKEGAVPYLTRLLMRIAIEKPQKGRMLDIGAATGFFMRLAEQQGWKTSGVELSEYAARLAQERGLEMKQGTFEAHAAELRNFDAVTMWDLVEHLPDPFAFFKLLPATLAPGGVVAFATPQSDSFFARLMGRWWTMLAPPQHLHYFSRQSIQDCLEDAGFELVRVEWFGKEFTISYILHFLMGWLGISWHWMDRVASWPSFQRWHIRLNTHDYMRLIVARVRV